MSDAEFERRYGGPDGVDAGIKHAVKVLVREHVETFESCEGGPGHAFAEPTVRFHGGLSAGWQALHVCMAFGLPVTELRRVWDVIDGSPTGPYWEVVFRPIGHRAWDAIRDESAPGAKGAV